MKGKMKYIYCDRKWWIHYCQTCGIGVTACTSLEKERASETEEKYVEYIEDLLYSIA